MAKILPGIQTTDLGLYDEFDDYMEILNFLKGVGASYKESKMQYEAQNISAMNMINSMNADANSPAQMAAVQKAFNNSVDSLYESDDPTYNIARDMVSFNIDERADRMDEINKGLSSWMTRLNSTDNDFGIPIMQLSGEHLYKYYDDLGDKKEGWILGLGRERAEYSSFMENFTNLYGKHNPNYKLRYEDASGKLVDTTVGEVRRYMLKYEDIMEGLVEGALFGTDKVLSMEEAMTLASMQGGDLDKFYAEREKKIAHFKAMLDRGHAKDLTIFKYLQKNTEDISSFGQMIQIADGKSSFTQEGMNAISGLANTSGLEKIYPELEGLSPNEKSEKLRDMVLGGQISPTDLNLVATQFQTLADGEIKMGKAGLYAWGGQSYYEYQASDKEQEEYNKELNEIRREIQKNKELEEQARITHETAEAEREKDRKSEYIKNIGETLPGVEEVLDTGKLASGFLQTGVTEAEGDRYPATEGDAAPRLTNDFDVLPDVLKNSKLVQRAFSTYKSEANLKHDNEFNIFRMPLPKMEQILSLMPEWQQEYDDKLKGKKILAFDEKQWMANFLNRKFRESYGFETPQEKATKIHNEEIRAEKERLRTGETEITETAVTEAENDEERTSRLEKVFEGVTFDIPQTQDVKSLIPAIKADLAKKAKAEELKRATLELENPPESVVEPVPDIAPESNETKITSEELLSDVDKDEAGWIDFDSWLDTANEYKKELAYTTGLTAYGASKLPFVQRAVSSGWNYIKSVTGASDKVIAKIIKDSNFKSAVAEVEVARKKYLQAKKAGVISQVVDGKNVKASQQYLNIINKHTEDILKRYPGLKRQDVVKMLKNTNKFNLWKLKATVGTAMRQSYRTAGDIVKMAGKAKLTMLPYEAAMLAWTVGDNSGLDNFEKTAASVITFEASRKVFNKIAQKSGGWAGAFQNPKLRSAMGQKLLEKFPNIISKMGFKSAAKAGAGTLLSGSGLGTAFGVLMLADLSRDVYNIIMEEAPEMMEYLSDYADGKYDTKK
tara:strand:- start:2649 stop:5681 length:3033 start_codon:yes stop_codon:yes gene_type:complete